MRPANTIHRSLTSMTVGLQQRLRVNQDLKRLWSFGEREQQFQFPFQGSIGVTPVETTFKILFDHIFAGDPGYARDSQLGEPIARFGFRLESAPPGTIPYAHVSSWIQDDDLNYKGANVTVGAHNPASLNSAATFTEPFNGLIHCTFQGYGCAIDNPGDILAGADDASGGGPRGVAALPQGPGGSDGDLGGTSGSSGAGAAGGGTGITIPVGGGGTPSTGRPQPGGGSTGPTSLGGGGPTTPPGPGSTGASGSGGSGSDPWYDPKYHRMPKYPSGPLGGYDRWNRVHTWDAGGDLGAWDIPAQEGALRVANDTDGRLTCKTVYEVTRGTAISYSPTNPNPPTIWNPPPGSRWVKPTRDPGSWVWYLGDKYAARWTSPGRVADGYKIRLHFLSNPTGNDFYDLSQAVVVNMRDRSTGLAFFWNADGAGWTTDLRQLCMGPMNLDPGLHEFPIPNNLITSRDSEFTIPHDMGPSQQYDVEHSLATIDSYDQANPPLNRFTPEQQFAQYALGIPNEAWVELWRDGRTVHAAIYHGDPGNGSTPSYMSDYQLGADDPNFGPNIGGYFGWTMSYMIDGKNAPDSPYFLAGAHSWPFDTPQRGILSAALFQRTA